MQEKSLSIWWLRGIATALGLTPTAIVLLLQKHLEEYFAAASPAWQVNLTTVLVFAIGVLLAMIVISRPWLRWDEPTGTWINRFGGIRYCEKCKVDKKVVTPLKNEVTGWRCMSCERWYADPARRSKEDKPKPAPRRERI